MKEIASEKDHVDVTLLGQTHYFVERFPAVVAPDGVPLVVAHMIVC